MNKNALAISAGALAAIFCANANAMGEKARIVNMAPWPAVVTVEYGGMCRRDSFTVPAATKAKPGEATSPESMGACLITSVTATLNPVTAALNGKTYPVKGFTSKPTPDYEFIITYTPPYEIKARKDLGEAAWAANLKNTRSPEGDYGH
jgi:hypothetical protein